MSPLAECIWFVVFVWVGSALSYAMLGVGEHTAVANVVAGTLYVPLAYRNGYLRGKAVQQ